MAPCDGLKAAPDLVSTDDAGRNRCDGRFERRPLVDPDRQIRGLITRKDLRFLRERPYASKDSKGRLLVAAAIGCTGDYIERADQLAGAGVDCFFVDIAHGHSVVLEKAIESLKTRFPEVPLISGNVATGEGARFMQALGADGVKAVSYPPLTLPAKA